MNDITTIPADLISAAAVNTATVTPVVDLFTNTPTTGRQAVIGDFTLPTYTGYAAVTPTFGAAYVAQGTGLVTTLSSDCTFVGPTSGAGTDVNGWVCHNSASPHQVYAWGSFSGPQPLQQPTDILTLDFRFGFALAVTLDYTS